MLTAEVRHLLAEFAEQMNVGAAEAVNRLVVIADRKELAPGQAIAAQRFDQLHLHRVGVLQLVD